MTPEEAERKKAEGEQMLEQLGDIPVNYAFACELPAAHGEPLEDLDRVWYDRWSHDHRDWMVVLNGEDSHREIDALGEVLEAGAAYVVVDSTRLVKLTPVNGRWYFDADTGDRLTADNQSDVSYWDDALTKALHHRLVTKGKDLPPLEEMFEKDDAGGEL